jgi:hypothetical protein
MGSKVKLRPVEAEDLPLLGRFLTDPEATGEFEWFGYRVSRVKELERRWHEDGLIGEESFRCPRGWHVHWVGQLASSGPIRGL